MTEAQFIKQIKKLNQIKPNKDWVVLTKREIISKPARRNKFTELIPALGWLFTPIRRPALVFAFRGVVVAVLILAGSFFYLYYLNSQTLQETLGELSFFNNDNHQTERMLASLTEVKASLSDIQLSLEKIKDIGSPSRALAVTSVIKATAERNKETLDIIKNQSPSKKVLASIGEIDETLTEISNESYNLQKDMISAAIKDLKSRSLLDKDKVLLDKAEIYYSEGNIEEAMILIIRITENENNI
jgi:hypothetical protein